VNQKTRNSKTLFQKTFDIFRTFAAQLAAMLTGSANTPYFFKYQYLKVYKNDNFFAGCKKFSTTDRKAKDFFVCFNTMYCTTHSFFSLCGG
jgi:hypothetical protein